MQEIRVQSLGWEDSLEKEVASHSSILAWKIPWTEEPGWLQSMGSQELDVTEWPPRDNNHVSESSGCTRDTEKNSKLFSHIDSEENPILKGFVVFLNF